jgi:hypothetical protein
MRKQRWMMVTAVALALAVGVACDDDAAFGPENPAGTMVVSLTTPNADDGAIMFTVSGGEMYSPTLSNTEYVLYMLEGTNTLTAVVVGDIEAGALLEFGVPALNVTYTATVTQVADRLNDLRDPLTGYDLTVDLEVTE